MYFKCVDATGCHWRGLWLASADAARSPKERHREPPGSRAGPDGRASPMAPNTTILRQTDYYLEGQTMPRQISIRFGAALLMLLSAAACASPSAVAIGGDKQETVFFGLQQRRHGRVCRRLVGQHERRAPLRARRGRAGPRLGRAGSDSEILCVFLQRRDLSHARHAFRPAAAGDARQPGEGGQVDQEAASPTTTRRRRMRWIGRSSCSRR